MIRMVNAGKRVVSNSAILMVSQVLSRLIRMILVIFAARLLGDESYGQFTFALSFTTAQTPVGCTERLSSSLPATERANPPSVPRR